MAEPGPGTQPGPGQSRSKDVTCPGLCFAPAASMVPQRKGDIATIVLRALLTGICVSMLNACLAGRSLPAASVARRNWGGMGKGLNPPLNACAGTGTAGLSSPWLCQGLPKTRSSAGCPPPHLGWAGDTARAAFGALHKAPCRDCCSHLRGEVGHHSPRYRICMQVCLGCRLCVHVPLRTPTRRPCPPGLLHVPTEVGDCVTFLSTANFSSTSYTMYRCCKRLFARWV